MSYYVSMVCLWFMSLLEGNPQSLVKAVVTKYEIYRLKEAWDVFGYHFL